MNFFNSMFSDEQEEIQHGKGHESPPKPAPPEPMRDEYPEPDPSSNQPCSGSDPNSSSSNVDAGWSFGGLLKTLSTRSESVLETYRRDLEEFGSGLKKETTVLKEVASRAVRDFPASMDVAQGSLETVGHAIDKFGNSILKSTAGILTADAESDSSENNSVNYNSPSVKSNQQISRFTARAQAIQSDPRTYCEEPEDSDDFLRWEVGFRLEERREEIEKLLAENVHVRRVHGRVVPNEVDHGTFWSRYFYKIYKLKQADDVRASLVQRAMLEGDDEDLRWDNDEVGDDEEMGARASSKADPLVVKEAGTLHPRSNVQQREDLMEKKPLQNDVIVCRGDAQENEEMGNNKSSPAIDGGSDGEQRGGNQSLLNKTELDAKEGIFAEGSMGTRVEESALKPTDKGVHIGSSKKGSASVVCTQSSLPDEDDIEWDEIEDLSINDAVTPTHRGGSPSSSSRGDLRKRLSVAEEEEDLSWDVEDEDEPTKA